MIRIIRDIFLPVRFFIAGAIIILIFIAGYALPIFVEVGKISLMVFFAAVIAEISILFRTKEPITAERITPRLMNLGDENTISILLKSNCGFNAFVEMVDELPEQFQKRNFGYNFRIAPAESKHFAYTLRPVKRGAYAFGKINFYISTFLGLVQRRFVINEAENVPVYPSILQMKNMELKAFSKISMQTGIKKIRRIGHSYEFEQIKNYVPGDDYRSINWKATGRKGELMVNQYDDEKSQQVYFLIDKSRSMGLPFNDLSLLDYSINTTLVMANIALKKSDKAGLISFGAKMESVQKAERTHKQLQTILELLYREKEHGGEANYELLYATIRNIIRVRSLIVLFTNFESTFAMERALPVLRKISRFHLLVVVIFENSEVKKFASEEAQTISDIYLTTVAGKFNAEKEQMIQQLRLYGIQTIYTTPENLSMNVVNKYLELKSRGMI